MRETGRSPVVEGGLALGVGGQAAGVARHGRASHLRAAVMEGIVWPRRRDCSTNTTETITGLLGTNTTQDTTTDTKYLPGPSKAQHTVGQTEFSRESRFYDPKHTTSDAQHQFLSGSNNAKHIATSVQYRHTERPPYMGKIIL